MEPESVSGSEKRRDSLTLSTQAEEVLFVGFNQDHGCFAVGTTTGFAVWEADPLKLRFKREFDGGIGIVELLYRTNILALVGGGPRPKFPPDLLVLWDDYRTTKLAELQFTSDIKSVRLTRDRIVVAVEGKVYIYQFADLALVQTLTTDTNPKGVLAVASDGVRIFVACPAPAAQLGSVIVQSFNLRTGQPANKIIAAHKSGIGQLALTRDGTKLATASVNGTVVYVWDTTSRRMLAQFTRGTFRVTIHSLAFNDDGTRLAVTSETGTVHIFILPALSEDVPPASGGWGILNYVYGSSPSAPAAQRSVSQCHIDGSRSIAVFSDSKNTTEVSSSLLDDNKEENALIAVSMDGQWYRYTYDTKEAGEAKPAMRASFVNLD
eukprot:TRINITY_DN5131_c0_g1_i3.p1 TRINITY_DN5131_c0_g1~~TRINITY_DN5131_c0_g1_i3.p1  ORF type:complete len:379 (-),score=49.50 TRINITY_DN5131_c0_g1_i3:267-1403(-)